MTTSATENGRIHVPREQIYSSTIMLTGRVPPGHIPLFRFPRGALPVKPNPASASIRPSGCSHGCEDNLRLRLHDPRSVAGLTLAPPSWRHTRDLDHVAIGGQGNRTGGSIPEVKGMKESLQDQSRQIASSRSAGLGDFWIFCMLRVHAYVLLPP